MQCNWGALSFPLKKIGDFMNFSPKIHFYGNNGFPGGQITFPFVISTFHFYMLCTACLHLMTKIQINGKSLKLAVWAVSVIFFVRFHIVCDRYTSDYDQITFSDTIWPLLLSPDFGTQMITLAETASYKEVTEYFFLRYTRFPTVDLGLSQNSPEAVRGHCPATSTHPLYTHHHPPTL